MQTHYQVLGISSEASLEEVYNSYRRKILEVLPTRSLYPTSPKAIDRFKSVQDAYDCLIQKESRAAYDANLRELAEEERSLFGERREKRAKMNAESERLKKAKPPYVWDEEANGPLFWNPRPKLITGGENETVSDSALVPVAVFKRSSLNNQLVLKEPEPSTKPPPTASGMPVTRRRQSLPVRPTTAPASLPPILEVPLKQEKKKDETTKRPESRKSGPWALPVNPAMEYLRLQKAQLQMLEDRHRKQVQKERERMQKELDARRKQVEMEREIMRSRAERLRAQAVKEAPKPNKQVRWSVFETPVQHKAPQPKQKDVHIGPYTQGWWSEPAETKRVPAVLKKRRVFV